MVPTGHTQRLARWNVCVLLVTGGSLFAWLGGNCGGVPLAPLDPNGGTGRPVLGAATGNEPPTLTFVSPVRDLIVDRGLDVLIEWTDTDSDSNAVIEIVLDRDGIPNSGNEVPLISERLEDPDGFENDRFILSTGTLQTGNYIVRARISDGVNAIVQVQAPGILSIVPPGTGPRNAPPTLVVLTPDVDTGVAQGDTILIRWRDTDPDDNAEVLVLLDKDNNPNNDDPFDPAESGVIVLPDTLEDPNPRPEDTDLAPDPADPTAPDDVYSFVIDVSRIPIREDGLPYFVRVMISDGINPPVNRYATGTLRVLGMASGTVDLARVGKQIMGARWQGFNPGALTGSRVRSVTDADGDGTDDCCIVARFGNPSNVGNVGESWLLLGRSGQRFGGHINVNSIGTRIPGHVFTAPAPSAQTAPNQPAGTQGVTDVLGFPDTDGDGLPELVFGLPHVDGLPNGRDDDPADADCSSSGLIYPDSFGQFLSDPPTGVGPDGPPGGESMGFVSMVSSTVWTAPGAEDGTAIALESSGQGGGGTGARWQVCIFDPFDLNTVTSQYGRCDTGSVGFPAIGQPGSATINARWGESLDLLPDIDNDLVPELIVSAPKNMQDIEFWRSQYPALLPSVERGPRPHSHLPVDGRNSGETPAIATEGGSRFYEGNVVVFFGQNWSGDAGDQNGTVSFPYLIGGDPCDPPLCRCPIDNPDGECAPRALVTTGFFEISAEKPSDELGGARSASDFNLDGPPDIVMGAPFADRGNQLDVGAAYIVYGRLPVGDTRLSDLNNPSRPRPPTVRIFGDHAADRLGSWQESVQDLNGDRIEDVVIATGDADGPNGIDSGFVGVIFGGQQVTGDFTASELATPELRGIRFYGAHAGDRAGVHAASAGDFNSDGFGDLLITAPGEFRVANNTIRRGVVYLIFGGTHLNANRVISLDLVGRPDEDVNGNGVLDCGTEDTNNNCFLDPGEDTNGNGKLDGTEDLNNNRRLDPGEDLNGNGRLDVPEDSNGNGLLDPHVPGIVFVSPYELGSLDEAAPLNASFVGDLDGDGFSDIMIGNPEADFVDPEAPTQRRPDAGEVYLVYGSNAGTNSRNAQSLVTGTIDTNGNGNGNGQ